MSRAKFARKLGMCLVAMLAVNSMASISVQASNEITREVVSTLSNNNLTINPLPQSMEILQNEVELTVSDFINVLMQI